MKDSTFSILLGPLLEFSKKSSKVRYSILEISETFERKFDQNYNFFIHIFKFQKTVCAICRASSEWDSEAGNSLCHKRRPLANSRCFMMRLKISCLKTEVGGKQGHALQKNCSKNLPHENANKTYCPQFLKALKWTRVDEAGTT